MNVYLRSRGELSRYSAFAIGNFVFYYLCMVKNIPYFFILFLAVGGAASAGADEILKDSYNKRVGTAVTRPETKRQYGYASRSFVPSAVNTRREIVIDKQGRRIGLAIPNSIGETNNDLLRLRSGKRVGNQIFDPAGRRAGTIIRK